MTDVYCRQLHDPESLRFFVFRKRFFLLYRENAIWKIGLCAGMKNQSARTVHKTQSALFMSGAYAARAALWLA
jgi:hypothetical protein